MKKIIPVLIIISLMLGGCAVTGDVQPETPSAIATEKEEVIMNVKIPESVLDFTAILLSDAVSARGGDDTVLSPLSALYALSMAEDGAEGSTLEELRTALSCGITDEEKAELFGEYMSGTSPVKISNSVWVKEGFDVKHGFLEEMQSTWNADVYNLPFDGKMVQKLNETVKGDTDGLIPEFLKKPVDGDVLLVNATALDALWETPYEKYDIVPGTFLLPSGKDTDVDYLKSDEQTYLESDGTTGFIKPYKGGRLAFVGILPPENVNFYDYIHALDGEALEALLASAKTVDKVETVLPRFRCDCDTDLRGILMGMGVRSAFDPEMADFTKMADTHGMPFYINNVKQDAVIEVSETGTQAAAVTEVEMLCGSVPMIPEYRVYLNRPFVYMIIDTETGFPLFAGAETYMGTELPALNK